MAKHSSIAWKLKYHWNSPVSVAAAKTARSQENRKHPNHQRLRTVWSKSSLSKPIFPPSHRFCWLEFIRTLQSSASFTLAADWLLRAEEVAIVDDAIRTSCGTSFMACYHPRRALLACARTSVCTRCARMLSQGGLTPSDPGTGRWSSGVSFQHAAELSEIRCILGTFVDSNKVHHRTYRRKSLKKSYRIRST